MRNLFILATSLWFVIVGRAGTAVDHDHTDSVLTKAPLLVFWVDA